MNIQFRVSFKDKTGDSVRSKIRIFYSLRKRRESCKIISSFIDELRESFPVFEWEISGFSDLLFNLKYLGIYFSSLPTIFIEINHLRLEEQEVLQELMAKVLIRLQRDSVSSIISQTKKSPLAKRRKKQTKKANPLLPPPEGPVFQFVPLDKGKMGYPFLPPYLKEEQVYVYQSCTCVKKQNKVELNLLEEVKKWSQSD